MAVLSEQHQRHYKLFMIVVNVILIGPQFASKALRDIYDLRKCNIKRASERPGSCTARRRARWRSSRRGLSCRKRCRLGNRSRAVKHSPSRCAVVKHSPVRRHRQSWSGYSRASRCSPSACTHDHALLVRTTMRRQPIPTHGHTHARTHARAHARAHAHARTTTPNARTHARHTRQFAAVEDPYQAAVYERAVPPTHMP